MKDPLPKENLAGVIYQIPCWCTLGKCRGAWRPETKTAGMHAQRGIPGSLPLRSFNGISRPSRLGWDDGARQGHLAYTAEGKGGITPRENFANTRLNWDRGYELPGCWNATMKSEARLGVVANCTGTNVIVSLCSQPHGRASAASLPIKIQHFRTSLHSCPEDD